MKYLLVAILLVLTAAPTQAQQELTSAELRTIVRCVRHGRLDLLGDEFQRVLLVRYRWSRDDGTKALFFAFRSKNEKHGRLMQFSVEGKRPHRHFTMSNDANFDGRTWIITSDPLGGVYSHKLFPAQLLKLRREKGDLHLSLSDNRPTEGTCDSYVEPNP